MTISAPVHPELLSVLTRLPLFQSQRTAVLAELVDAASCAEYPPGGVIFGEGETNTGLFVVISGTVRISRFGRDGREFILHMLTDGETFNDVAALDGGLCPATATAHTETKVCRISREALYAAAARHPALANALIENMAQRIRYLVGVVHDLSMRNVRGRLARLLLEQTTTTEPVSRPMTQEEMANRLGTVREMIGRTLRSLAADGMIEIDRHRIVIVDAKRLQEAAET